MNSFQIRTWIKYALLGLAASIIAVSLVYTDNLVERLKEEERVKVNSWAEATRIIVSVDLDKQEDISYPLSIVSANTTIPVIAVMDDHTPKPGFNQVK